MNIELSEEEARLFTKFRENQDLIEVLEEGGVLSLRGGCAHIHKDAQGTIQKIVLESHTYKRKK